MWEAVKEWKYEMAQKAAEFSGKELAEKLPETVKDIDIRTKQWFSFAQTMEEEVVEDKKVKPSRKGGSGLSEMNTGVGDNPVNRRVKELEAEMEKLKAADLRVAPLVNRAYAMRKLKNMWLMPSDAPDDLFDLPSQGQWHGEG